MKIVYEKVFGIVWNLIMDNFCFKINLNVIFKGKKWCFK